jgi:hypothetical protein
MCESGVVSNRTKTWARMDATEMVIVNMSIVHIDIAYARQPALVASMLGGDKSC